MDDDDSKDKKDAKPNGHLIVFPGGKKASTDELGADYVVGQGGHVNTPELVDPAAVTREFREREQSVGSNELVKAIARRAGPADLIDEVIKEVAEELAHLKFERAKAAKEGKNTANYNMSRVAALRQIADVLMKRQENARAEQLDLKSPRFQQVVRLWMEFVYESAEKAGVSPAVIDLMFNQMKADMVDWEKKILDVTG
jgi:type I site-specific restriction endonuclease